MRKRVIREVREMENGGEEVKKFKEVKERS